MNCSNHGGIKEKPWDEAFRLRECHPLDQVEKLEYLSFPFNPFIDSFINFSWLVIHMQGRQADISH